MPWKVAVCRLRTSTTTSLRNKQQLSARGDDGSGAQLCARMGIGAPTLFIPIGGYCRLTQTSLASGFIERGVESPGGGVGRCGFGRRSGRGGGRREERGKEGGEEGVPYNVGGMLTFLMPRACAWPRKWPSPPANGLSSPARDRESDGAAPRRTCGCGRRDHEGSRAGTGRPDRLGRLRLQPHARVDVWWGHTGASEWCSGVLSDVTLRRSGF